MLQTITADMGNSKSLTTFNIPKALNLMMTRNLSLNSAQLLLFTFRYKITILFFLLNYFILERRKNILNYILFESLLIRLKWNTEQSNSNEFNCRIIFKDSTLRVITRVQYNFILLQLFTWIVTNFQTNESFNHHVRSKAGKKRLKKKRKKSVRHMFFG